MNVPPGGHGGYPGGQRPPSQGPWRSQPSTTTRRGPGFSKNQGGSGCAIVVIAVIAILCVAIGAVGFVLYLKGPRTRVDDAPDGVAQRAGPDSRIRRDAGTTGLRPFPTASAAPTTVPTGKPPRSPFSKD